MLQVADFHRLEPGWKAARTEEGAVYFFHAATGKVQWEPPSSVAHSAAVSGVGYNAASAGAPHGIPSSSLSSSSSVSSYPSNATATTTDSAASAHNTTAEDGDSNSHYSEYSANVARLSPFQVRALRDALPTSNSVDDKARRRDMFRSFDVNGNGYLSLAEVDKAVRDALRCDHLFDAKPAIMRAFQAAKNCVQTRAELGADYVERSEFRLLLTYLQRYFELYLMFDRIDARGAAGAGDHRIDRCEFGRSLSLLKEWGWGIAAGDVVEDGDPGADAADTVFARIDVNGGGFILFDEFCDWAISHHLRARAAAATQAAADQRVADLRRSSSASSSLHGPEGAHILALAAGATTSSAAGTADATAAAPAAATAAATGSGGGRRRTMSSAEAASANLEPRALARVLREEATQRLSDEQATRQQRMRAKSAARRDEINASRRAAAQAKEAELEERRRAYEEAIELRRRGEEEARQQRRDENRASALRRLELRRLKDREADAARRQAQRDANDRLADHAAVTQSHHGTVKKGKARRRTYHRLPVAVRAFAGNLRDATGD